MIQTVVLIPDLDTEEICAQFHWVEQTICYFKNYRYV